jgi:hypothetical protein
MTIRRIEVAWDDDAKIWYVAKTELPGLVSEAPTYELLMERAIAEIPKLVALNRTVYDGDSIVVSFVTEQGGEYPAWRLGHIH